MATAVTTALDNATNLTFKWTPETENCYAFFHFAEIENLQSNEFREFDISVNGMPPIAKGFRVPSSFLEMPRTWESPFTFTGTKEVNITLIRTANSTHPPIVNALEIFMLYNFSDLPTQRNDGILRTSFSHSNLLNIKKT